MASFWYNIINMRRREMENYLNDRLARLSLFSPSEIEQIQLESNVPKEELLEVLEILYDPKIDYYNKVSELKSHPYGMDVLVVITTMGC